MQVKETTQPKIAPLEEREERRKAMLKDRDAGMTLSQIGAKYGGLSKERVRQILSTAPKPVGLPRSLQLERRRKTLLARRKKWVTHDTDAGRARVAQIDEELEAIEAEWEDKT